MLETRHFGMDAEIQRPRMANYGQKLLKVMGTDSDMSSFTMSNGMHCETREKNCTISKINNKPDQVGNITLFGKK